jgi:prephenate dehydrogenase
VSAAPRAGVVGLGLIGGSLLKGLAAAGASPAGADADPAVAGAARAAGFDVVPCAAALAAACDVVVVCVPPARTAGAVAELLAADPSVIVADVASVKAPVLREVAAVTSPSPAPPASSIPAAPTLDRYVPAHPLAGSELAGWAAGDAALLRDAVWAVCPPRPEAGLGPLCTFARALEPLGPRLLACDVEAHDAALARTSHVPHVVAQALAKLTAAGGLPLSAALSGGAYRDMTRTARSDPALWVDIIGSNRAASATALRALLADLERLAAAIERGDDAVLGEAWSAGAAARATVDAIRWTEPEWRAHRLPSPTWAALLDLGRAGVLVRRPQLAGGALELEAGAAPPGA